jgi:hypothetical protein
VAISASIHAGILVARYVSHNSAHSCSREHNPTRSSRFVGKFVGKRSSAPGRDSAHDGARRDAGEALEVIRGVATAPSRGKTARKGILSEPLTIAGGTSAMRASRPRSDVLPSNLRHGRQRWRGNRRAHGRGDLGRRRPLSKEASLTPATVTIPPGRVGAALVSVPVTTVPLRIIVLMFCPPATPAKYAVTVQEGNDCWTHVVLDNPPEATTWPLISQNPATRSRAGGAGPGGPGWLRARTPRGMSSSFRRSTLSGR